MEMRDDLYLRHIRDAMERIMDFSLNKKYEDFVADRMFQGAVIHPLLIIGEAAGKVSMEYKSKRADLPWRGMIGMRNKLIHDYFRVSLDEIWKTATEDIPELKKSL